MSRNIRPITDYDLAVRALDSKKVKEFLINHKGGDRLTDYRKQMIEALKYYRDPLNQEEYHRELLTIQTKLDGIIPFRWKRAQRVFYNEYVLPRILKNEPVRIYVLKARQLGFSTQIEGIGTANCALFSDFRSAVIAHDKDTASKIFRMCKLFYKSLPEEFKPARKLSNRHELELANPQENDILGLESSFSVGTAQNLHLGAGTTLRFIHLSEFARYEEVNSEAEDALITLIQTVPRKGGTYIFAETTAYGEGLGKRFWDDERNGFDKVFISWIADDNYTSSSPISVKELGYDDKDRYGDEISLRDNVIEELQKWYPEHQDDKEWLKRESLCRLQWRREYVDTQCFGKVELFQQEYPITPDEAFRISGKTVFNAYILNIQKKEAEKLDPQRYSYVREITPKQRYGYFTKDSSGSLKIYKPPIDGVLYQLGSDIGSGIKDGDYSCIQVFDESSEQVAVYSDIITPDEFAYVLAALGVYYNKGRLIPEANSMGISTIARLVKDIKYPGPIYIRKKINSIDGSVTKEYGFYTSAKTRPILINRLRHQINNQIVLFHDVDTIHELLGFIYRIKDGRIKMEASPGMHDDLVLGSALGLTELNEYVEEREDSGEIPEGSIEWYAQKMDRMNHSFTRKYGNVVGI